LPLVFPAKLHILRVEPRGFEPLTSAVQRRRDALRDIPGARKIAAKVRISLMTLFPSLRVIDSGCCTVAAHESSPCPKPAAFPLVPLRLQSQGTVKADIEGWLTS
jgi:hypothetical protein